MVIRRPPGKPQKCQGLMDCTRAQDISLDQVEEDGEIWIRRIRKSTVYSMKFVGMWYVDEQNEEERHQ